MEGGKKSRKKSGSLQNGNGGKPWSPEEIGILIKMREQGRKFKDIAKKLGRSVVACQQFNNNGHTNGHKNGNGKKTRWTKKEKKNLARMENMGLTIVEIAEMLDKKPDSVINKIKSLMESNEWEKLVKEVIEEDKVDSDDDMLQLLEEDDVSTPTKDTNEKLKL